MSSRLGVLASHPIQYQAPLFRALAKYLDLTVFFSHRQSAAGQAAAGFGVPFEWDIDLLGGYKYQFLRNKARYPNTDRFSGCDTPEIAEMIERGGFDAFLVTGWYLKSYWQAIRACRRYGVPVMVRGDSQLGSPRSWFKHVLKEIVYPHVLSGFDACLYVGQRNLEYLNYYGVPNDRLFFSPHCVDNDMFADLAKNADQTEQRKRFGLRSDEHVILFVGKLLSRKRPADIVDALDILKKRGESVCCVFVGDGPLRSVLENYASEKGVHIVFLGFRNQTEIPVHYVAADALVLPSDGTETWGLVVNEALACGTPVVVSNAVGCAPDLALDGRTGLAYEMGNVAALADAIQKVLATPVASDYLAETIRNYSVEAAARGVLDAVRYVKVSKKSGIDV